MNQEETGSNFDADPNADDNPETRLDQAKTAETEIETENSGEIENVPVESIGSYARLDAESADETSESSSKSPTQS